MNELKYLIYQALINCDSSMSERETVKEVKRQLDKERVSYDPQLIDIFIEMAVQEIEEARAT